ncbi:hypothetical protein GGI12_002786 [Dipsacomyces acuminosporus]|nr:hypothetical protein GGI12_002786 [Dipsacomyces acuminosporus]
MSGSSPSSISIKSNGRLPPNAQRRGTGSPHPRQRIVSSSTSIPSSLAHATEILAESPPSARVSASTPPDTRRFGSAVPAVDGDDTPVRSEMTLSEPEAAKRLKRHLVTRPVSMMRHGGYQAGEGSAAGSQPRSYGSISNNNGNAGYSGDEDNEGVGHEADKEEEEEEGEEEGEEEEEEEVTVDPFILPSGDVTHHIYRWQEEHSQAPSSIRRKHIRGRSFSAMTSDSEWDVPYTHNQIRAPGGFRRQFIQDRARYEGRPPTNLITANFVDFIGLYGHFAGGDYPSDEDDDEEEIAEETIEAEEQEAELVEERHAVSERVPLRGVAKRHAHDIKATATPQKAFFLLVKAFVGTGVLVLPRAFFNGGLIFSSILMSAIAWYALHCMVLLTDVYLKEGGSYGDLAQKLYGRYLKYCVMVSIVLAQLGFCCAYVIFVSTNMRDLWNTLTGCRYNFSPEFWILVQLLAYIPLAFVRKIKKFASLSLIGNFFILVGLGYLFTYDFWYIVTKGPAEVVQFNPSRFPLLVGTAAFSYEGISLVIPIVESMEHKEKFNSVLTASLTICAGLFVLIGALSYMTFGSDVEAVILLNLPHDSTWTLGVQFLYSLAIILSVPLQLFPAIRIIESGMFTRSGKGNPIVKWQKNLFRTLMVLFIAMVAIFGAEKLDNFIAIVGASSCLPLSFLYPVMLHYKSLATTRWSRFKDMVLIVVALFALVYVTFISIQTWGSGAPPLDRCATP